MRQATKATYAFTLQISLLVGILGGCSGAGLPTTGSSSSGASSGGGSGESVTVSAGSISPARFLTALTAQNAAVTLSWEAPRRGTADSYLIYRSTSADVDTSGSSYASVAGNVFSYNDTSVSNGTRYFYKVLAVDASNVKASDSNEADATPWDPVAAADSSNLFVNFSAGGGGNGSYASPYNTLAAAHTAVAVGGTINIMDGTRTESLTITKAGVTLRSLSGNYRESSVSITGTVTIGNHTTPISGVRIMGLHFNTGRVWPRSHSTNWVVSMNHFENGTQGSVATNSTSGIAGWTIYGNFMDNLIGTTVTGLNLWAMPNCQCVVSNNTIDTTTWAGIQFDSTTHVLVEDNIVANTPRNGIQVAMTSGNITIRYNTLEAAGTEASEIHRAGVAFYKPQLFSGPVTVTRNTFTSCRTGISTLTALNDGQADAENDLTGKTIEVSENNFEDCTRYAIEHSGASTLDAGQNYWGHSSGPLHSSNASGLGGEITDGVSFSPFLSEAAE